MTESNRFYPYAVYYNTPAGILFDTDMAYQEYCEQSGKPETADEKEDCLDWLEGLDDPYIMENHTVSNFHDYLRYKLETWIDE